MKPDTLELIRLAQAGDRAAAERLTEENQGLIWSIARRFFGRGVEADDLYQLAALGFLKAVGGFDPAYGTQFSTYAVPKIAGEIRRFLRDDGAVKVSRGIKERYALLRQAREILNQRLGREPTLSELSAETGLDPEAIAQAEAALAPTESLQQEGPDGRLRLDRVLGDDREMERVVEHLALDEALGRLEERERMVISLRYFHGLTQDRSARVLGVSQVQVSRLERRALGKLRELLSGD
ncbi:MAG: sigma-70 family RNA polymerase sigma factor [Oscillospiraceae bacterium]|nr:sigma-70 family RNA polymerase sigma factor [Oscillospiraceae bacterium]